MIHKPQGQQARLAAVEAVACTAQAAIVSGHVLWVRKSQVVVSQHTLRLAACS
ncbi:MAG: hypothetical protein KDA72_19765 [Planctomycetales bacterium]|nr:hypothetical protein [Planctomycetales bacterium]